MENSKISFLKDHADTLAIIAVNVGIAAILVTLCVTNMCRIDATNTRVDQQNARSDALFAQLMDVRKDTNDKFYDLLKEGRK